MSYTRATFMGASVRSFGSSIGWNLGQPSTLSVQLVVDPQNGDSFSAPILGTPAYFSFYQFKFAGIVQRWRQTNDSQANPTYEVQLVDPRELLDCVQVITNSYNGTVEVPNLWNAFGYYENTYGFGAARSNTTGMPWTLFRDAVLGIANNPLGSVYGNPLVFKGISYSLDLSQLPAPPNNYRIGGGISIGLLEAINQVCEDGGCDFFVELVGYTIRIRTVSRRTQPTLNMIEAVKTAKAGTTLVSAQKGQELRNETTSAFLVGGNLTTLHQTSGIVSFWGYDIAGNAILGSSGYMYFSNTAYTGTLATALNRTATVANLSLGADPAWPRFPFNIRVDDEIITVVSLLAPATYRVTRGAFGTTAAAHTNRRPFVLSFGGIATEYMNLNASKVASIIGAVNYYCSTLEMRLALIDFNTWSFFIATHRRDVARQIQLASPFLNNLVANRVQLAPDMVNDGRENAVRLGQFVAGDIYAKQQTFYEFVKLYAQNYMGKKYAVSVPFVLRKQDDETLRVSTSYEVTEGGYLPEGSSPLGLSLFNEDTFKNQDGTFKAFVRYDSAIGANLAPINPSDSVLENNKLYLSCTVDPHIIQIPAPAVVITINDGLSDAIVDSVGSVDIVAGVLNLTPAAARTMLENKAFGAGTLRVAPAHRTPTAVAVPLRSTVLVYGPWFAAGATGKVRFESDPSLTPWEYGGYDLMNAVGNARVTEAVTSQQTSETGDVVLSEPPTVSLGDALQANGAPITNIQVTFGQNGVSTSYSFQTYTPSRVGVFHKGAAERLKKNAQVAQELRRAIRTSLKANQSTQATIAAAARGAAARARMFAAGPPVVNPATPHDVIIVRSVLDEDEGIRVGASTCTYEEAVAFAKADDSDLNLSASVMSLAGLIRPFTTKVGTGINLPAFGMPTVSGEAVHGSVINPWKAQNDIEIYSWGETYDGLHATRRKPDLTTNAVRGIGLRAPIVAVGWGYDTEGNATPGAEMAVGVDGDGFAVGALTRSDWHFAGPVDLMIDKQRKVWTCHDICRGVVQQSIGFYGSGLMDVIQGNGTGVTHLYSRMVFNSTNSGKTFASGEYVMAGFDINDKKWHLMSNGGSGTSSSDSVPSGTQYTVYHTGASGTAAVWSQSPTLGSMQLGGPSGVPDGFLTLSRAYGLASTTLYPPTGVGGNQNIIFPANVPTSGDYLAVKLVVGSDIETEWAPSSGLTASAIPSGTPLSVYYTNSNGITSWATGPQVYFATVGGSGSNYNLDGYLRMGRTNSAFYTSLYGGLRGANTSIYLPDETPVSGDIMTVKSSAGNSIQLQFSPEATGQNYSVWHINGSGQKQFSSDPILKTLTLGGSGITDGIFSIGSASASGYTIFKTQERTTSLTYLFPSTTPSSGQTLYVKSISSNIATLDFLTPNTGVLPTIPTSGLSYTRSYVSEVSCVSGVQTITYKNAVYQNGLLVSDS